MCFFFASQAVLATSVRQLGLDELLDGSELVFDGEVIDIGAESSAPPSPNTRALIFTRVTFRIHEVIKGTYKSSTIQLRFLGGSENGKSMLVDDMRVPKAGEQGIYFVERIDRKQVHPLYGWSQGHFLVVTDPSGIKRVMTSGRQAVAGVISKPEKAAGKLSKGVAKGLTLESAEPLSRAMRVDDFKRKLSEMQGKAEK